MSRQLLSTAKVALLIIVFLGLLGFLQSQVVFATNHLSFPGLPPMPSVGSGVPLSFPTYDLPTDQVIPYSMGTEVTGEELISDPNAYNLGEPVPPEIPATTLGSPIYDLLYSFVLTVFGSLFGWAGNLMSFGMNNFVLGFGTQYFDKNVGVAVESVWTVVRDLFNLTFIFGLVYIGFKMILDSSDSQARSMLIHLIGAALLVNFSLFIVKFVIDLANITAIVIAKAGFNGQDIANSFINLINFSTMLNISNEEFASFGTGGAFAYIFGLMIFLATAAFVFAAAGILFIVRFVVLNIYLVFSPILFIGWVFPSLKQESSKFWNGLLGNAFFAPAYLMMIYLSFQVLSRYREQIGEVNYASLFKAQQTSAETLGAAGIIPFFILAMVFMVLSLVVAKKMGAVGASTAISIGNKLRGSTQSYMGAAVGGATFGLAARAGRNTVGALGNKIATNEQRLELASQRGLRGWTARQMIKGGRTAADSSFEARQVASVGKNLGIGSGKKEGYKTLIEATAKTDQKFAESLGILDKDDSRVAVRIAEKEHIENNIKELKLKKTEAGNDAVAKAKIEREILKAETELKDATEKVEKEKRRRQIGGTFTKGNNDEEIAKTQIVLDTKKAQKKDLLKKIISATGEEQRVLREELKNVMGKIKTAETQIKYVKSRGTDGDGYARVVDIQSGWDVADALLSGRTINESKESAKALVKKFTKETQKTKEDNNFSSIEKAIKDSVKSDH